MTDRKRTIPRFPYSHPFSYVILGDAQHAPDTVFAEGRIMNVSSGGMRMKIEGRRIDEGTVLLVRIPLSQKTASVPSLAQVRWIKETKADAYEAGLKFVVQ